LNEAVALLVVVELNSAVDHFVSFSDVAHVGSGAMPVPGSSILGLDC
jgi:hypothetical protein